MIWSHGWYCRRLEWYEGKPQSSKVQELSVITLFRDRKRDIEEYMCSLCSPRILPPCSLLQMYYGWCSCKQWWSSKWVPSGAFLSIWIITWDCSIFFHHYAWLLPGKELWNFPYFPKTSKHTEISYRYAYITYQFNFSVQPHFLLLTKSMKWLAPISLSYMPCYPEDVGPALCMNSNILKYLINWHGY